MKNERIIKFHRNGDFSRCMHNQFTVDPRHNTVECAICGEKLNPIWVLEQFCNRETRVMVALYDLEKKLEKAKNKTRCKCCHCGKMTPIIR